MELDPQYQPKEACGVFGIYDLSGENTAPSVYYGLLALQHRGQNPVVSRYAIPQVPEEISPSTKAWGW